MEKRVFIITEKPDAAFRIASALDDRERPQKMLDNGIPYYVARHRSQILVVPSMGHLYTITDAHKRRQCAKFAFDWVPRYFAERKATGIRAWIQVITRLSKKGDVFIDACDYDVEGCVIGYFILKYACGGREKTAQRMKYSTLTREELRESYAKRQPNLDFGLVEAGRTRHEVDWLYGVNLSRCLTNAAKNFSGRYATLSIGRVQGPTLKFLVEREKAIRDFVPTQYWKIKAKVEIEGRVFEADYEKERFKDLKDAQSAVEACKDKIGLVKEVEVRQIIRPPPFPFNLSALQNEAYAQWRYAPQAVLSIAQRLYLKALISYPRTDSEKLPSVINYRRILNDLNRSVEYQDLTSGSLLQKAITPNEGRKDDPAHVAIYPTGRIHPDNLASPERRLFDLIVRRFVAVFGEPAVEESTKVRVSVGEHFFYLSGRKLLKKGWMSCEEPFVKFKEIALPQLGRKSRIKINRITLSNSFTQPPSRYNSVTLLNEMEKASIGTKATRAETIQTLQNRGYIRGERLAVTPLGFEIAAIMAEYCPQIVSTELTGELEARMDLVREGKEDRQKILADVIGILTPVVNVLESEQKEVGERLSCAVDNTRSQERTLGPCPVCHTGSLIMVRSRETGKRFVGCTNYFKECCRASFPLPQRGALFFDGNKCVKCNWPTVKVRVRRRSWALCLNPECSSKKVQNSVETVVYEKMRLE